MRENILIEKTIEFAARIVKLHRYLVKTKHESVLPKQILRSGTSIGANVNEAQYGHSKADFIAKLHIALKETAETEYWLRLLEKSDYLDEKMAASLITDCLEIKRILIASLNTAITWPANNWPIVPCCISRLLPPRHCFFPVLSGNFFRSRV